MKKMPPLQSALKKNEKCKEKKEKKKCHCLPPFKIPPILPDALDHHSCGNLAQAVGNEEGDGDEAVVADPGKPLQAPLKPNRLHQINLQDKVLISLESLEVTHQGDLEDRPLAEGVEEGEGAKRPKSLHKSLEECSQSHRDH